LKIRTTALRSAGLAALTAAAVAVPAAPASAGVLVTSASNCPAEVLSQPFAAGFGDTNNYVLAPNGNVESGTTKWSVNGASAVSGNEPWHVHGASESHSLSIPSGKSATTGSMCVGIHDPSMRFFVKADRNLVSGLLSVSTLKVDAIVKTSLLGLEVPVPVAVLTPSTSWRASDPLIVLASLLPLFPNDRTPIAFRFTAVGGASWTIDDVYVDPRARV
jgi:hypothetical protein